MTAEQPAEWDKDKSMTVMADLLTRFPSPQIDFVYALDDPMALGAVEAIRAAGRLNEIKVFGQNGEKGACDAIKGEMAGTQLLNSGLFGLYTVRAANDALMGRPLQKDIGFGMALITAKNVDQMYGQCW